MSSTVKVPSSIVPVHIGGEPFSRMTSFRRSLIHVDFLVRRKKKDKRRNTVAEGETKEIKDVFQNIINDESQYPAMKDAICSEYEKIIAQSKNDYNTKVLEENDKICKSLSNEKNNNSANESFHSKYNYDSMKVHTTLERNKAVSKNCRTKLDLKNNINLDSVSRILPLNRKKPKSHIPISTVSAAMSVAVEMRQQNGINADQSSSVNWNCHSDHNSSDSESKSKFSDTNHGSQSSSINEEPSVAENCFVYRDRLKEKGVVSSNFHKTTAVATTEKVLEIEEFSSASSENCNMKGDDLTPEESSMESDAFFISSDESDGEVSGVSSFHEKCGSTTSLSTISDGSLNSLLSQTGSEMNSSTGTLTSVGQERLPTPPPPPPMVLVAPAQNDNLNVIESKCENSEHNKTSPSHVKIRVVQNASKKSAKKSKLSYKHSKPLKKEFVDLQRNITGNSKNIFSSLVNMKMHSKEQQKVRVKDCRHNKVQTQPVFDMYGNHSPKKPKQLSSFIKGNTSPDWENLRKSRMQSFSPYQSGERPSVQNDEKINSSHHPSTFNGPTAVKNLKRSKFSTSEDTQASSDSFVFTPANSEVPFKYVHQVTVTPLQRFPSTENGSESICKQSHGKTHREVYGLDCGTINNKSNSSYRANPNNERPLYSTNIPIKYHNLNYFSSERPKSVARVVLDAEGKVIYCTNSLDRKHYGVTNSVKTLNKQDEYFGKQSVYYNKDIYCKPATNYFQPDSSQACPNGIHFANIEKEKSAGIANNAQRQYDTLPNHNERNRASTMVQLYSKCDISSSDEKKVTNVNSNGHVMQNCNNSLEESVPKFQSSSAQEVKEMQLQRNFVVDKAHFYSLSSVPDPNISGLPLNEIAECDESLPTKQMQKLSITPHSFHDSPENVSPLQISSGSPIMETFHTPKQSTMSTEDLFAVIHNCKKRMNIKTDSDISLSSSRSSSQSNIRSSSTRGGLVETGFLSPRSPTTNYDTSGDRRSWADFRPIESLTSERKSLASDRLGPTKPTSMHDFKMLLLQARSSSQVPGPRKSAVEMLKVPSPQDKNIKSLPLNMSQRNSVSFSVQNSPTSEIIFYNGHSTVPFKRGNRVRSSLQSRYTMYPPIFEDCSEEAENCREFFPKNSVRAAAVSQNENESRISKTKKDELGNFVDNPRLWV